MKRRTLVILVGALAVLIAVASIALRSGQTGGRNQAQDLLLPGLKDQLNDIRKIVVTGPGNAIIATLEQGKSTWAVQERNSYPADIGRIRRNLLALAEARILEEKTSNPEYYARLGVQDMGSASAGGLQLTLADGKKPVSVIIGLPSPGTAGQTYVRRGDEATSWLIAGQFDLGKTTALWLDRSLTDIPAARIQSVTISHPGLETVRISRPTAPSKGGEKDGQTEFLVANIPSGRELSYPGVGNGIASALADLQLEDVQPREMLGDQPGKPVVARFVTTDGLVVEASAWRLPDGTRFTFLASGVEPASQEAAALNARLGGWVYTLPSYKTEQLTRRLDDLLLPVAK